MSRPVVGQYAPLPRPTARRMSDLHPYARLSVVSPARWDHIIGRFCAVALVGVLVLLAAGIL